MAFTKQEILRMIQDLQDQADSLVGQGEYKLADQRLKRIKELKEQLKHTKDSVEILKLSGFTTDAEEQWITVNGAHVKVEGGESKESATKKFIKKKGGNPEPAKGAKQSPEVKYDEKEINKIKERWSGESKPKYGSEYGDILDYLKNNSKELPDEDKYYELSDKLIDMRKAGKKDTPEYKAVEKQRNDYNKTYNKVYKALEEKARSLVSKGEQKRLEELNKMKDGDIILPQHEASDECGEKVYTKGTEDAIKYSFDQLVRASWTTWEHIVNNPGKYDPSTVAEAQKLLNTKKRFFNVTGKDDKFKLFEIRGVGLPEKYIGSIEADSSLQAQQKFIQNNPSYKNKNIKAVKDADPKVVEAQNIINLCGGVR